MVRFRIVIFTLAFSFSLSHCNPLHSNPWLNARDDNGDGDATLSGPPLFPLTQGRPGNYFQGILANHPPGRPTEWVGLGDSFAAGPGAGQELDHNCRRHDNGYPNSMQSSDNMPGPDDPNRGPSKPRFTFIACTGHVTTDLTDPGKDPYQMRYVTPATTFATLSIGGNDVKFADILEKCVYGQGKDPDCNTRIQGARDILYGPGSQGSEMFNNYNNVLYTIMNNMQYRRRNDWDKRTAVYITSYPQFFETYTTQCNDAKFVPKIAPGPKITQELRTTLNRLTHEVNYVIQYWIDVYNFGHTVPKFGLVKYGTALDIVDQDIYYDGHRFCRENVKEPDRNNDDTWFFHYKLPGTSSEDTMSEQQFSDDFVSFTNVTTKAEDSTRVIRTFHPKSRGHQAARDYLLQKLYYSSIMADANKLSSKYLDIIVAGDSVPYGSGDPRSAIYEGFIPHLSSILRDRDLFPNGGVSHQFHGTQNAPYVNSHFHECYPGAKLDTLLQHFRESPDMQTQNKIVLLTAGTYDVMESGDNYDAAALVQKLRTIVDFILGDDQNAVVFVAQIPMVGSNDDGHFFATLQRRIIEYNAEITAMVNEFRVRYHRRVMKIHITSTTYEHQENNFVLPSDLGYTRIAYDFLQGLVFADNMGWFDHLRSKRQGQPEQPEFPTMLPTPSGAPTKTVSCQQERPTDAPEGKKLVDSFTSGKDIVDWIGKTICDEKVICANALNGKHPKLIDPSMVNGTDCIWSGGQSPDESNYYQLTLHRYDAARELKYTVCPFAVDQILNECVNKGKFYGGWYSDGGGIEVNITNLKFPDSPLQPLPSTTGIPFSFQSSVLKSTWSPAPTEASGDPTTTTTTNNPPPPPTSTNNPPPPPPSKTCPDPYPDIFKDGQAGFEKWLANQKNKCDNCPDGKYDFCAKGGRTCQCTDKMCTDSKDYMCWK